MQIGVVSGEETSWRLASCTTITACTIEAQACNLNALARVCMPDVSYFASNISSLLPRELPSKLKAAILHSFISVSTSGFGLLLKKSTRKEQTST